MRIALRLAIAFGAVVLMAGPALAQRPGFGMMGMGGGGLQLLGNKSVQQEIKLDGEQTEKVAKYVQETSEKRREQFLKLQDLSQDERREKMGELMRTANEETQKALKDLLKPDQLKRFNQIELQQRGFMAFADPAVRQQLKLTEDQAGQVRTLADSFRGEMGEIMQNNQGNFQEIRKQSEALRKQKTEKALALLTSEQSKTWKEMTGEPFEVKFEPRPAGVRARQGARR
jgi:hypothetical protein